MEPQKIGPILPLERMKKKKENQVFYHDNLILCSLKTCDLDIYIFNLDYPWVLLLSCPLGHDCFE
jgi:hypothetical protein